MSTFTINFLNNSSTAGNFCIFQQNNHTPAQDVYPLAWRVERGYPGSRVAISWNIEHYFFWGKTGPLQPGVVFYPGENSKTDLLTDNNITLTKEDNNYKFKDKKEWNRNGEMAVMTDTSIAFNQASIGIGMSGVPAYAVQAQPNMYQVFSPLHEYWITFARLEQGQVLNPSELNAAKIDFPHGIFSMNATLNPDNTWTITQGMD